MLMIKICVLVGQDKVLCVDQEKCEQRDKLELPNCPFLVADGREGLVVMVVLVVVSVLNVAFSAGIPSFTTSFC
jgi:hypothetical protein